MKIDLSEVELIKLPDLDLGLPSLDLVAEALEIEQLPMLEELTIINFEPLELPILELHIKLLDLS